MKYADLIAVLYTRVWDVADYVIPPAENGAFFVATNVIITANQTRGESQQLLTYVAQWPLWPLKNLIHYTY